MKINIEITFSKIMAFLILILSTAITLNLEDVSVFSISLPIIAAMVVNKQYQDRIKKECDLKNK